MASHDTAGRRRSHDRRRPGSQLRGDALDRDRSDVSLGRVALQRLGERDAEALQRRVGNRGLVRLLASSTQAAGRDESPVVQQPPAVARAKGKPGVLGRLWNRVRQVFGYKLGSKASKKLLLAVFDGRTFSASRISLLDEAGIQKAWDKIYGKGTYDGTCAGCTEADGPLEGFQYKNRIYINTDTQAIDTVPHEMLHTAEHGEVIDQMGENCNEGFTEYLTQKAVRAFGYHPSSSYPGELAATRSLAALVGEGAIESAYFDGKVRALKRKVDKAKGSGTFRAFVKAMKREKYAAARALVA